MPDFNVGTYLAGDVCRFHDVPSEAYPDGRTYTVPAPSAADELRLRRIIRLQGLQENGELDDDAARELVELVTGPDGEPIDMSVKLLGSAFEDMTKDGVTPTRIDMLTQLVMTAYGMNSATAQLVLERAEGEALAASNRETRRAAAKKAPRKRAARKQSSSSLKAGPSSSQASTDHPGQSPASTRTRSTSAAKKAAARKTA